MAKKTTNSKEAEYPKNVDLRLQQLRFSLMEDLKVDAFCLTHLPNIRYLTNFSGSAATLFVTDDEIHFITDDRYEEQIKTELFPLPNLHTHISRDVWGLVKDKKILKNVNSIAFEADKLAYSDVVDVRNLIKPVKLKPSKVSVDLYNISKSPEELQSISEACNMAVSVYNEIIKVIKPGLSEKDLAAELGYIARKKGSEGDPFSIIFVSGERGALVHGQPSDKKVQKGDIVLMDFGCTVNGFVSDISRTVAVGSATEEQKDLYKMIFNAKETAISNVKPGMNGKLVDAFARDIIEARGYGEYFQHSLGHGIGLAEHEMPIITFRSDEYIIPENCALAIEPGIYLPNKFGIRVEDDILVTRNGAKHLTEAPSELPIIG